MMGPELREFFIQLSATMIKSMVKYGEICIIMYHSVRIMLNNVN